MAGAAGVVAAEVVAGVAGEAAEEGVSPVVVVAAVTASLEEAGVVAAFREAAVVAIHVHPVEEEVVVTHVHLEVEEVAAVIPDHPVVAAEAEHPDHPNCLQVDPVQAAAEEVEGEEDVCPPIQAKSLGAAPRSAEARRIFLPWVAGHRSSHPEVLEAAIDRRLSRRDPAGRIVPALVRVRAPETGLPSFRRANLAREIVRGQVLVLERALGNVRVKGTLGISSAPLAGRPLAERSGVRSAKGDVRASSLPIGRALEIDLATGPASRAARERANARFGRSSDRIGRSARRAAMTNGSNAWTPATTPGTNARRTGTRLGMTGSKTRTSAGTISRMHSRIARTGAIKTGRTGRIIGMKCGITAATVRRTSGIIPRTSTMTCSTITGGEIVGGATQGSATIQPIPGGGGLRRRSAPRFPS